MNSYIPKNSYFVAQSMISKEEVAKIAKLARLELTEQETEKMQKDMSAILDYFDILKKTPKVEKAARDAQNARATNVVRKDAVVKNNLAGDLIVTAPDTKGGYIKVKSIF